MPTGHRGAAEVFLFSTPGDLPHFWRGLYKREQITEDSFFKFTEWAFPALKFHPDLAFRRFDGSYPHLRDDVVRILGALNDHFATAFQDGQGIAHHVQALMGPHGVDLSPESPRTRSNPKLMAQRMVEIDGRTVRCEWHAKIEPHRNRIHFSLPEPAFDGRIVVGIFHEHLDT